MNGKTRTSFSSSMVWIVWSTQLITRRPAVVVAPYSDRVFPGIVLCVVAVSSVLTSAVLDCLPDAVGCAQSTSCAGGRHNMLPPLQVDL